MRSLNTCLSIGQNTMCTKARDSLCMRKTENVETMLEHHFGCQLQPLPINEESVEELGNWLRREFHVSGNSWDVSSIHVALGDSLVPQRSNHFEVPGFTVSLRLYLKQASKQQKKKKQRKETVPGSLLLPDNAADSSSC